MRTIALTGGIACGKTTVAGWLRETGAVVIDADAISRKLTVPQGPALPAIRQAFGDAMFTPEGALDRAALGRRVFGDQAAREKLNGILHPMILAMMRQEMENCRKAGVLNVVLDVPLLYEAGMEGLADKVICVSAPERLQLERLIQRDGLTREQALRRIHSQWSLAEKEKRADGVIHTEGPRRQVRADALQLYHRFAKGVDDDPIAAEIPKR